MAKQSFKAMSLAVAAGIILSAFIITLSCAVPKHVVNRMYAECKPFVDAAIKKAHSERNGDAADDIEKVVGMIEKRRDTLLIFYDHKDVAELFRSAETALELAKTNDTAQLLAELCDIGKAFENLMHINDMSIVNIF